MSLEDSLASIRSRVQRGGVDLMFAFRSYDNLRLGRVPASRVAAILDANGIQLPHSVVPMLIDDYRHERYPAEFDYTKFCTDMENTPTFHPTASVPRHLSATAMKMTAQPSRSANICARFRQELLRTRRNVDEFFKIHDKHNNGRCTPAKFASALTCTGLQFSRQDLDTLINEFQVSPTDVDYRTFVDIINRPKEDDEYAAHYDAPSPSSFSSSLSRTAQLPRSVFDQPVAARLDVGSVITKAHYLLKRARVSIEPATNYFQDHDPLRKGVIARAQFESVLSNAYRLPLTAEEVEVLVAQYSLPMTTPVPAAHVWVDYRAFVEDVAIAGQGADVFGVEKAPTRDLDQPLPQWCPQEENAMEAEAGDDAAHVQRLIDSLAAVMHRQRVDLEPHFLDRDPYRRGCVNLRQFHTVLCVAPMRLSERDRNLLAAHYQKGAVGIDFRSFIADLRDAEAAAAHAHAEFVSTLQQQQIDPASLPARSSHYTTTYRDTHY